MSPLSARRMLTALTLAILLCAAPVLAQAPARTARPAHAVAAPTQLSILDVFQNAVAHFITKITVSGGGGGGVIAGPRMDPEGHSTSPGGTPSGTP
jgi:hypothetical protein